jgi:hypothetical protein
LPNSSRSEPFVRVRFYDAFSARRATASAVTPYNSSAANPQGDPGEEPGEHGDDAFLLERIVHLDVEHLKPHSERRLDCGERGVDLWRHRGLSSGRADADGEERSAERKIPLRKRPVPRRGWRFAE